jgi:putative serine protease PepD
VDSAGRIVGVNSAIATLGTSSTSGNIGLGFSIPINQAKRISDELIETGKSTKPLVGISFDNNFTGVGARIAALSAGKAAERAGMAVGSIVKRIDGFKINDSIAAIVRIRSHAPGDQVVIVAELPTGESKTYTFNLDSAPALP